MTNEQIAQRAVENAETAAQIEIKDMELRASLIRNFVQELDMVNAPQILPDRGEGWMPDNPHIASMFKGL